MGPAHYLGAGRLLGEIMSDTNSMLHKGLTIVNILSVCTGLIMSIVIASNVLGWGCDEKDCQSMLYITTTFLSTRKIETTLGWPVATERALSDAVQYPFNSADGTKDRAYRFGHYLECMYTARMADKACSPGLSFPDYSFCLTNNSAVLTGLDQCASFPTVGGIYYHWPTSEEYLGCLWNNPLLQNSESQRASKNVFRACVEKSLWPFFEVPQGIDTPVFMGSYNWGLLLLAGLVVMTSFGVYQMSYKEEGTVRHGETSYFMRLGLMWSGLSLIWDIAFLGVFLAVAFRGSGEFQKGGGLPTTSSTTFVTFLVLAAAVVYFLAIVVQPADKSFRAMLVGDGSGIAKIVPRVGNPACPDHENQRLILKGTLPGVDPKGDKSDEFTLNEEQVANYYTPPLLAVWADSYFADFCIVMGIAGATGQLSTDQAWSLFTFTFMYRLLNMIISRCMSDAFMNNIRLDKTVNDAKNGIVSRPNMFFKGREHIGPGKWAKRSGKPDGLNYHLNIRVIGLTTQLAALYLYIGLLYMVFNSNSALNDFNTFKGFFVTCFVVPEALRLLVHLFYQVFFDSEDDGVPWMLYNSALFIWLWDYIFRLIWVCVVILETSNNPGTLNFLKTQTNALMRDYVPSMAF